MILTPLILALPPVALAATPQPPSDLLAIKARWVETGTGETLEHAVILVEDGKIVTIGEDLPIERGIPVLELDEGQVVMAGLVSSYTRTGMSGSGYNDSRPWIKASDELYPPSEAYDDILEAGVTTLGQMPQGNGISGQAVAVRPEGDSAEEMIIADSVYLRAFLRSSGSSKRMITDGFKKADEWLEKEKKNKEKWEKDVEKAKKKKKDDEKKKKEEEKNGDDAKKEDEKKDEGPGDYKPLDPDPKAQPFLDLRSGKLKALFSISTAGNYLHLIDAIGEEEFDWDLRIVMGRDQNMFHVKDKIAEHGCRVVMEPTITLHPGTMRQRNIPAEFQRAGVKLVFIPRSDSVTSHENWLRDVGELIAAGLDRAAAVRAMTLDAAELLGVADQVGSLEPGKAANLIILSGDPFEVGTEVEAVMLDGEFVSGEVEQ